MKVLVTGSKGFVGKNLCAVLRHREDVELLEYDIDNSLQDLDSALEKADCIIHLAGVNRPKNMDEFETGNAGSLDTICTRLETMGRAPKIVLSSSIQADLENPYGLSKRHAELRLKAYAEKTGAACVVYRLKNLFGKWCRPNYNSVTATFCHNIARGLPIQVSDPAYEFELTYIDDVVKMFVGELAEGATGFRFGSALSARKITLGELADKIRCYRDVRQTLRLPNFESAFDRALYATYLSYLEEEDFGYALDVKSDERGSLAEFIKSPALGQIFVSHTKPGITRGHHFHHTKTEKFLVVKGTAVIRFRHIERDEVIEYEVRGEEYRVLDIPPGYTHSIENVGVEDLVTLFWTSEMFDPGKPDTYFDRV
ncbi:MAG: NAD-dependent epimerase/dehydratase family protein [Desulfobacterales bacterium]|nr:NAD-dependent epimerase/dehydratase family protein [Desulfobacterales bacterium]